MGRKKKPLGKRGQGGPFKSARGEGHSLLAKENLQNNPVGLKEKGRRVRGWISQGREGHL